MTFKEAFNEAMEGTRYQINTIAGEDCIMRDGFMFRSIPRIGNAVQKFLWYFIWDHASLRRARVFDNLLAGIKVPVPEDEGAQ